MERPVWCFLSFLTRGWHMLISSKYVHLLVFVLTAAAVVYHWCRNTDPTGSCSLGMAGDIPGIRLWAPWALGAAGAKLWVQHCAQAASDRAAPQALVCTCCMICQVRDSPCSREWQPLWKTAQSWGTRQIREDSTWWTLFGQTIFRALDSVFAVCPHFCPLLTVICCAVLLNQPKYTNIISRQYKNTGSSQWEEKHFVNMLLKCYSAG